MFGEPLWRKLERETRMKASFPELNGTSPDEVMAIDADKTRRGAGTVTDFSQRVMQLARYAAEEARRREEESNRTGAMPEGIDQGSRGQRPYSVSAPEKRPGVPRGVAEAFPETVQGGPVYDSGSSAPSINLTGSLLDNREGLPGPVKAALDTPVLGTVLTEAARPSNWITAASAPAVSTAARSIPIIGGVAAALTGPVVDGGVAARIAGQVGAAAGATIGEQAAEDKFPLSGLAGGLVGGLAGAAAGGGIVMGAERLLKPKDAFEAFSGLSEDMLKPENLRPSQMITAGAEDAARLAPTDPGSATQRLFAIQEVKQGLKPVDRAINAVKSTLGIGVPENDVATPIMRERMRVKVAVDSQAARLGAVAQDTAKVFRMDGKGRILTLPGEPTIQDLAAKYPQYVPLLTAEQRAAMQRLHAEVAPFGDSLAELGIDVNRRADVVEGGFYLPRGRADVEGADVPLKVGTGRGGAGGKKGFERGAVFDSMTEGIEAGYEYAPVHEALQSYAKEAGQRAIDQWTTASFKATGLGETAADRINPGLRAEVETLRAKIAQARSTLIAQRSRENALRQGARDTARMYESSAGMAQTAREQLEGTARTAAKGEDIARSAGRRLEQMAAGQERAARDTASLADRAGGRLRRLQERLDAVRNPKPVADALEGAPREAPSFQQIASSLPDRQVLRDQAHALRAQLTRDKNGQILRNRRNNELMRQIGEYDALGELHYALERADGDIGEALTYFDETLQREGFALQSRNDPGLRNTLTGQTGGRARAARRRAARQGFADMYTVANRGSEQDYPILSEQVRAMHDIMEAGDFNVYDALDTPPVLGNAPTEEVIAAAKRELQILQREANKQERRSTLAWSRALAGGDALEQQARRNTQRASERAESGARAVDRGMRRQEAVALRSQDRYIAAGERQDATGAQFDALREQMAGLEDDWRRAKEHALQTPRDQGSVGLAGLNGTSFPDDVANAANKYLNAEKPTTGRLALPVHVLDATNNLLRGLRATADVSFMGIQGLLGAASHPVAYSKALVVALKSLVDDSALGSYLVHFDQRAARTGALDSRAWAAGGLHIGGSDTEFAVRGVLPVVRRNIANAPIARQSNRAFGTFGDVLRLETADAIMSGRKAAGMDVAGTANIQDIARGANLITGWTRNDLGAAGNLAEFAPRFFRSQLDLVAHAMLSGHLRGRESATGDEARRALIRLVGVGTAITVAANEASGNDTDFSPGSPNFMRIRDVGGRDISLFGPWDSLVRAISASAKGEPEYLLRSKASPTVALAWDLISGETFTGENSRSPDALIRNLLPFSMQEIPKAAGNAFGKVREGDFGGAAGAMAPIGVGLTGLKASPLTPTEQLDSIAQDQYGTNFYDLEPSQQQELRAANPDLAQQQLERGSDQRQAAEAVRSDLMKQQERDDAAFLAGDMDIQAWKDQRTARRNQLDGALGQIYIDAPDRKPDPSKPWEVYGKVIADHTVNGQIDWDAVDAWRASITPEQNDAIDRNIGLRATPLEKEYRAIGQQLNRMDFFDLREKAWEYLKARHPEQLGKLGKYEDWYKSEIKDVTAQVIAKGVPPETAALEAKKIVDGYKTVDALSTFYRTEYRHAFVTENKELALQAVRFGYFTPDAAEARFLRATP